jgi:hypothetical protein
LGRVDGFIKIDEERSNSDERGTGYAEAEVRDDSQARRQAGMQGREQRQGESRCRARAEALVSSGRGCTGKVGNRDRLRVETAG